MLGVTLRALASYPREITLTLVASYFILWAPARWATWLVYRCSLTHTMGSGPMGCLARIQMFSHPYYGLRPDGLLGSYTDVLSLILWAPARWAAWLVYRCSLTHTMGSGPMGCLARIQMFSHSYYGLRPDGLLGSYTDVLSPILWAPARWATGLVYRCSLTHTMGSGPMGYWARIQMFSHSYYGLRPDGLLGSYTDVLSLILWAPARWATGLVYRCSLTHTMGSGPMGYWARIQMFSHSYYGLRPDGLLGSYTDVLSLILWAPARWAAWLVYRCSLTHTMGSGPMGCLARIQMFSHSYYGLRPDGLLGSYTDVLSPILWAPARWAAWLVYRCSLTHTMGSGPMGYLARIQMFSHPYYGLRPDGLLGSYTDVLSLILWAPARWAAWLVYRCSLTHTMGSGPMSYLARIQMFSHPYYGLRPDGLLGSYTDVLSPILWAPARWAAWLVYRCSLTHTMGSGPMGCLARIQMFSHSYYGLRPDGLLGSYTDVLSLILWAPARWATWLVYRCSLTHTMGSGPMGYLARIQMFSHPYYGLRPDGLLGSYTDVFSLILWAPARWAAWLVYRCFLTHTMGSGPMGYLARIQMFSHSYYGLRPDGLLGSYTDVLSPILWAPARWATGLVYRCSLTHTMGSGPMGYLARIQMFSHPYYGLRPDGLLGSYTDVLSLILWAPARWAAWLVYRCSLTHTMGSGPMGYLARIQMFSHSYYGLRPDGLLGSYTDVLSPILWAPARWATWLVYRCSLTHTMGSGPMGYLARIQMFSHPYYGLRPDGLLGSYTDVLSPILWAPARWATGLVYRCSLTHTMGSGPMGCLARIQMFSHPYYGLRPDGLLGSYTDVLSLILWAPARWAAWLVYRCSLTHTMGSGPMGYLARIQMFSHPYYGLRPDGLLGSYTDVLSPILFFIRIDKAVVCVETDYLKNDKISFHMNYSQRYSALSC